MANEKLCFKDYLHCVDDKMLSKTRRKMNKKSHKGRHYGGVAGDQSGAAADGAAGESESILGSLLSEFAGGQLPGSFTPNVLKSTRASIGRDRWNSMPNPYEDEPEDDGYEEEAEPTANKIDIARGVFNSMIGNPQATRKDIIAAMMQRAGVTESTAVSYYERIAKEAGMTNQEDQVMAPGGSAGFGGMGGPGGGQMGPSAFGNMPPETDLENDLDAEIEHTYPDDPNKQGIIRVVDGAHLVYKRQSPDGTFDELWLYNISKDMKDEIAVQRRILAGTDIPPRRTRSADGSQSYTMTTLGNAQYIHVTGLPN